MLKAMLFDLDGTLLDRDASLRAYVADQYDRTPAFHHVDKPVFVRRFLELDERGYVWKDRVYQSLLREFGAAGDWEALLADYVSTFSRHCVGFPGLNEMLAHLRGKGLKLGIVTNGYTAFQDGNIRALGLHSYFDDIVISEREGLRKPDPLIFDLALRRLGARPEEALMVGDHAENDVQAARQAGLGTVWKEHDDGEPPADADWTIRHLCELVPIVDRLLS